MAATAKPTKTETLAYEQFCDGLRRAFPRFKKWWRVERPFPEAMFFLECLETPRGIVIVQVFSDGTFFLYNNLSSPKPLSVAAAVQWAVNGKAAG